VVSWIAGSVANELPPSEPKDVDKNEKADEAYALLASGKSGKVAVVFDEELNRKARG
jgi:hypothetical protein